MLPRMGWFFIFDCVQVTTSNENAANESRRMVAISDDRKTSKSKAITKNAVYEAKFLIDLVRRTKWRSIWQKKIFQSERWSFSDQWSHKTFDKWRKTDNTNVKVRSNRCDIASNVSAKVKLFLEFPSKRCTSQLPTQFSQARVAVYPGFKRVCG